jgi:hypothetical protein
VTFTSARTRSLSRLVPALAVVVLAAFAFAGAASAVSTRSASQDGRPCWKKVLDDWFADGRIDGTYPPSCLNAALQHLPPDAQQYSDFSDEAHRALATDAAWIKAHPKRKAHYNLGIITPGHKGGGGWGPPPPAHVDKAGNPSGGGPDPSSIQQLIGSGSPSSTTSIPVPLLVLGGLAILLLLAGVASYLVRRFRGGPPQGPLAPAGGPRE